jgi:hypothetical protein
MADKVDPTQPPSIQIHTVDDMSRGRYSNLLLITHSTDEFLLDWILNSPNGSHLVSRIVVSPAHAKRIIEALTANLKQYEDKFGPVKLIEPNDHKFH